MPYCAYCGAQLAQVSTAPCPSCGNPSNGAPKLAAKSSATSALIVVAVVVVGLGLVAFAGILAAIFIPGLRTAQQRTKQHQTITRQRAIATALEAYFNDHKRYPSGDALQRELVPKYGTSLAEDDGWEHPFRYECWSTRGDTVCDAYALGSAGKNRSFERRSLREYEGGGATTNFNDDIVVINGSFAQYPEGQSLN
jgi:type II secretory pathway pseudopilin PulG